MIRKAGGVMGYSELLFYGGLLLMAAALALGFLALIVLKIQASRLHRTLNREYGPQSGKPSVPGNLDG